MIISYDNIYIKHNKNNNYCVNKYLLIFLLKPLILGTFRTEYGRLFQRTDPEYVKDFLYSSVFGLGICRFPRLMFLYIYGVDSDM